MKKLLALLLAIAMLATLCACGKKDKDSDKGGSNDPEAVAEAFAEADILEDLKAQFDLTAYDYETMYKEDWLDDYGCDDEDEFFEELSEDYDEDISSWNDWYKRKLNNAKESYKDYYGDDYKLKVKATDTEELDEDEIEDIIDYLLDECDGYIDEDAVEDIEEAMNVTVEASISGEDGEDSGIMYVTVVKIDGTWKVADYDYGYSADYDDEDYDYDDEDYDYDDDYYYDEY